VDLHGIYPMNTRNRVSRIICGRCEHRAVRAAALCLCLGARGPIPQPADDPLSGRWILNVERTHYGGGAEVRQRETFDCKRDRTVVECRIESVRAGGRRIVGGFTAAYDGPAGPTRGIPDVDQVRLTKVSASIADATFTYQGRAVFAYRAVRSTNGRSLTIISVAPDSRVVLNSVVVYDQRKGGNEAP
jgi:hypothetical protein